MKTFIVAALALALGQMALSPLHDAIPHSHDEAHASVAAASHHVMNPGDTLNVTCSTALSGTFAAKTVDLACAALAATVVPPTATTVPATGVPATATAKPTGTPVTGAVGKCGESMSAWHPPVINDCETGHEHGDAPPSFAPMKFDGPFNTSAMENTHKHTAMKGFTARFNNVDIYFRIHAASNAPDRASRFHSYEVWAKDPTGAVSHWQGWYDSGDPTAGGTDRVSKAAQNFDRPVIQVVTQADWDANRRCEQWYSAHIGASWTFGWTICDSTTIYQTSENQNQEQSKWIPTGSLGLTRRLEATFPQDGATVPRGDFYTNQFFEAVSGPTDPKCGTDIVKFGVTYKTICLKQTIAPSMPRVAFDSPGGNAAQRTFPGQGVVLPN